MEIKKTYLPPCLNVMTLEKEDVLTVSNLKDGVMIDGAGLWGNSSNQSDFEE